MLKKICTITICIMVVMGLAGCSSGVLPVANNGKQYKLVSEVRFPMSNVKTLNPAASKDEDTYYITKLIYDGLFKLDKNMNPINNLAKESFFDRKDRSITITLTDTSWHDGKPLTSNDVKFSLKAYRGMGTNGQYGGIIDKIRDIEVLGDKKLKVYFVESNNMSLDILTFPIIPAHGFDSAAKAIVEEGDFIPIGTGQYRVNTYDKSRKLVLVPNAAYHGVKAKSKVIFEILPGKEGAYKMLESGGLSLFNSKLPERETMVRKKTINIVNYPANEVEFIGFNFKKETMTNKYVRQAIAHAIDRKSLLGESYFNSGIINDNLYFPGYLGVAMDEKVNKYDKSAAEKSFKTAGYEQKGSEGKMRGKDGKPLSIKLLINGEMESRASAAESIKKWMAELGVDVTVVKLSGEEYQTALADGDFDMYIGSYKFDEQMDMRALLGRTPGNFIGYENKKLLEHLNKLRSGLTVEEMKIEYAHIRKILIDDLPYFTLLYRTYGALKSPTLKGKVEPVWNNIYNGCGLWNSKYEVLKEEKPEEKQEKTEDKKSGGE